MVCSPVIIIIHLLTLVESYSSNSMMGTGLAGSSVEGVVPARIVSRASSSTTSVSGVKYSFFIFSYAIFFVFMCGRANRVTPPHTILMKYVI